MSESPDVLYQCCKHCVVNPDTNVCWDLEDHGGHWIPCDECSEGAEQR